MPDLKYTELIDGIAYMPSPVSHRHGEFHFPLTPWLGCCAATTPGCRGGTDCTWLMGDRDVSQPDLALRILPEYGGQSRVEGIYAAGAQELILEVAASSRARDVGPKLKMYERMGVREYLVAVAAKEQIQWHELTEGGYRSVDPGADGIVRSRFFPGLWLDPAALWRIDLTRLFAILQEGIATAEHASFVAPLAAAKQP
jgi:Putative restriction endonuclease